MKLQLRNWRPIATLLIMLITVVFVVGMLGTNVPVAEATDGTLRAGVVHCDEFGLYEIAYFADNYNTTIGPVTVTSGDGVYFDWSSSLGIDLVIVKGGPDSNLYHYDEATGDTGLHAPINPSNGTPYGLSHIRFCVDFELGVSKTASASYDRTVTWDIDKEEDESFVGFAGDTFNYDYDVTITKNVVENNYLLSGVVTVHNPAPFEAQYTVTDTTDVGIDFGIICSGVLPPGGSVDCPYSSSAVPGALSGTNTAIATSSTPAMNGGQASAGFTYVQNLIGYESVTFNDNPYSGYNQTVSGSTTIDIDGSYTCSTGDVYGDDLMYTDSETNTGTLVETGQSDDATKDFTCYIWDVDKSADGTYDEQYGWEITKTVDPESQSGFAGDTLEWTWTITWESYLDYETNHAVEGVITVTNPAPLALTVAVADELTGGFAASVTCNDGDGGTSLTLAANSTGTCNYTAAPGSQLANNTATASRNGVSVSDTVPVPWSKGNDLGLDATISDTNHADIPVGSDQPYQYDDSHTCSVEQDDYDDVTGSYSGDADNTATITWNDGSDSSSADTEYDCYIWDVDKTAEGSYDEQYRWEITKTVDPESQSGFAGDTLEWTWTITWESFLDYELNHLVEGVITVTNPADLELTVDVTDYLTGGFAATVECNDGDGGTDLTIAANSSGTCDYTAEPGSQLAENTATASRNGVSVSDTVDVPWSKGDDLGLDATISDTNHADIPVGSDQPYQYDDSHTCSVEQDDYDDVTGSYSGDADNTATITWNDGSDSSSADTEYDCYIWDVDKTAEGSYDEQYRWEITKTVDPESQSGFAGDTLEWTWTITWESFLDYETNHAVEGVITVTNPADLELTVDVTDYLTGGFAATVVCNDGDGGTDLTIAANSSGTCDYTAEPGSQLAENTATASRNGVSVSDTVDVPWSKGNDLGLDAEISDTNHADIPVGSDQPYQYDDSHTCSVEQDDYDADTGSYSGDADNTATITWNDGSDSSTAETEYDCYVPVVSKDAAGTYNRYWDWTITKVADDTNLLLSEGQLHAVNYDVTVEVLGSTVNDWQVTGNIWVDNNSPLDMEITAVSDVVDPAIAGVVTCDETLPYTIPAGESLHCTYETAEQDSPDSNPFGETNTATATLLNTEGASLDFTGTADLGDFTEADEFDECIDVTDNNVGIGFLGTVCVGEAPHIFEYTLWFGAHPDADVILECGENTHVNVASFVSNDGGDSGEDDETVNALVECDQGCTLTPGYWKTHSIFGPAPYDDTWALLPGQESTIFFLSGMSYYDVLWTPPRGGNAYYILAHAYIAAELNMLNGASTPDDVMEAFNAATVLFETYSPDEVADMKGRNGRETRAEFIRLAEILDDYNNGYLGPGHCTE